MDEPLKSGVQRVNEMDAIINLTGFSLAHWPWTKSQKQKFLDSRVIPGLALASAIKEATQRPRIFVQASGINYYGLRGDSVADESTPPADDFLAKLTIQWEDAIKSIEELGVRRVVLRQAVVLARQGGIFPLMALPVRLFAGGPIGNGKQAVPWIHMADVIGAIRFLMENQNANGAYNLIAPTTNLQCGIHAGGCENPASPVLVTDAIIHASCYAWRDECSCYGRKILPAETFARTRLSIPISACRRCACRFVSLGDYE